MINFEIGMRDKSLITNLLIIQSILKFRFNFALILYRKYYYSLFYLDKIALSVADILTILYIFE